MTILFLIPYPLGQSPSQRFRFEQYFNILETAGFAYKTQNFWSLSVWAILYKRGNTLSKLKAFIEGFARQINILFKLKTFDFIFIHRECAPLGPPVIEWFITKVLRKKVIYDFDDSIWIPNTSEENKIVSFLKWHSKVKWICRWSYKVSCGNSYLAQFALAQNNHTVILPTTIDAKQLHNRNIWKAKRHSKKITIGWTGTHSTLLYLNFVIPILVDLELSFDFSFVVICNRRPDFNLKSLIYVPWSKETEIPDLMGIDIGIMPLTDDLWAQGKCGFKALQYMALEIPTIASPVGVNSTIIQHQSSGLLCDTAQEWEQAIKYLLQNENQRTIIGKNGRSRVIEHYSVSSNTALFLSLFE